MGGETTRDSGRGADHLNKPAPKSEIEAVEDVRENF